MTDIDVTEDELLSLLDDALDEIGNGAAGLYSVDEEASFIRCSQHWSEHGGFTGEDVAFLADQLNDRWIRVKEDSDGKEGTSD